MEPLWDVALDARGLPQRRFQAACALATYAPDDQRWSRINRFVAARLVTLEASALVEWRKDLRPARAQLIEPLASIYRDVKQKEQARTYATETLAEYAADRPDELFELLADAEQFQFSVLFEKLVAFRQQAVALAREELARRRPETTTEEQKESRARRDVNAAVALIRLETPDKAWSVLEFSPDPRARSYFVHWFSQLGGDPQVIIQRLDAEPDVTIRRALMLTVGEFSDCAIAYRRATSANREVGGGLRG